MLVFGGLADFRLIFVKLLQALAAITGLAAHALLWTVLLATRVVSWISHCLRSERSTPTLDRVVMDPGTFIIVRRRQEWDELMLVQQLNPGEWLGYTVTDEVDRWYWTAVRLAASW